MTRYTATIIENDQRVHAAAVGPFPNDKFGVYIGTYDESPSGSTRPVILLTSDGIFDTPKEALEQGQYVIDQIRANGWTEELETPNELPEKTNVQVTDSTAAKTTKRWRSLFRL